MDPDPQENFLEQTEESEQSRHFSYKTPSAGCIPGFFAEEFLYPPHLQAACLGSHWHSAFLL